MELSCRALTSAVLGKAADHGYQPSAQTKRAALKQERPFAFRQFADNITGEGGHGEPVRYLTLNSGHPDWFHRAVRFFPPPRSQQPKPQRTLNNTPEPRLENQNPNGGSTTPRRPISALQI
jgi:hypothetical protein